MDLILRNNHICRLASCTFVMILDKWSAILSTVMLWRIIFIFSRTYEPLEKSMNPSLLPIYVSSWKPFWILPSWLGILGNEQNIEKCVIQADSTMVLKSGISLFAFPWDNLRNVVLTTWPIPCLSYLSTYTILIVLDWREAETSTWDARPETSSNNKQTMSPKNGGCLGYSKLYCLLFLLFFFLVLNSFVPTLFSRVHSSDLYSSIFFFVFLFSSLILFSITPF